MNIMLDKLNLGCGYDIKPGFLNVDINDFHKPDMVGDVCSLPNLPSSYFSQIVAQDVLEHLERSKTSIALKEWFRLMKVNGILSIRIPSLLHMFKMLASPENRAHDRAEKIIHLLFGTQAYTGDYHLAGFTAETISHHLKMAGFSVCRASIRDNWMFDIDARKTIHLPDDEEYIHFTYFTILGRPVDAGALKFWKNELSIQKCNREKLNQSLLASEEYRTICTQPRQ